MKRHIAKERILRRRITSGVFIAMAHAGKTRVPGLRDALEVSQDTVNRWLYEHLWTLPALTSVAVYLETTEAEIVALGAETPEESLP